MSGSTLTDALRETLALFEESGPPLTTNEVADRLDLGRRSTYDRLERLAEHGSLETKKVGANARVWWRPGNGSTPAETGRTGEGGLSHEGKQLRLIVEAVEDYAISMLDPDGRVRTWNPGAERIKGYAREEIVGEHFSTFYTEADREAGVPGENLARAASEGVATDEGWRLRADGSTFWAHVTITAVHDEEGDLVGFGKITRDMTERREQEQAIQHERNMLDRVLQTNPVGIGVFRADGSVERINERMTELLWLSEEAADEYTLGDADVRAPSGEPLDPIETPAGRALEAGETVSDGELLVEDPDHGTRWLSVDAAPLSAGDDEPDRVIVTARDVTEQQERARRLELQRDELVSELEEMYERIDDAFLALDDSWKVTFVNDRAAEMVGLSAGDLLGTRVWDSLPEIAEGYPRERAEEAMDTQESTEFEFHSEILDIWVEVRLYPSETGLSVYFQDVTERKEREQELERYRTVVETMVDGVFVTDEEGRFAMVNDAYLEMTGYEREELIGEDTARVIGEENFEESREMIEEMLDGERDVGVWEVVQQRADGGTNLVESRFSLLPNDGEYRGSVGVVRDVSEQKERERRLERFERMVETVNDGVYATDGEGHFVYVNDAFVAMSEHTREELLGAHGSAFFGDRFVDTHEEEWQELVSGEHDEASFETTVAGPEGAVLHVHNQFVPLELDGEIGRVGVTRDVTEGKERERELEQYETIIESVNEGVYVVDGDRNFQWVNEAYAELLGYSREELVGENASMVVDDEVIREADAVAEEEGYDSIPRMDLELTTKGGDRVLVEAAATVLPGGERDGWFRTGVVRDITERKEREQELERYERIIETVYDGVYLVNPDGEFTLVNEAYARMTGYDREELVGMSVGELVDEETVERALGYEEEMVSGERETARFEADVSRADGDTFRAEGVFTIIERDGYHERVGVVRDITERKERERELERYQTAVDTASDVIVTIDAGSTIRDVNPAVAEVFGYEPDELVGESLTKLMPEQMRDRHLDALGRYFETGEPELDWDYVELPGLHRDGHEIPLAISFGEFEYDGERFFAGIIRDITERKRVQQQLEEERDMFGEGPAVVMRWEIGEGWPLGYVSDNVEEVLGYTPAELESGELQYRDLLLEEEIDRITREVMENSDETTERFSHEPYRVRTRDGGVRWVKDVTKILRDESGDITGYLGYLVDITERKERERELEVRVAQQRAVTELGRRALEGPGLDELMAEAAEAVAETLDNDYSKVLDLDPDSEELLLRQGVGWHEGIAGSATVSATEDDSQAAYTLAAKEPVVVSDLTTETRFSGPDLLTDHDVRSGVSTIIGPTEEPWGILGTHDRAEKQFSEHDVNFVQSVANILAAAIDRHDHEEEIVRQRERLAALDDLNEVVRSITDAVVEQSTREEIERAVCRGLADSESYEFAWIGDTDPATGTVQLRTEAGVEGYLDDITISTDPDDYRSEGPTAQAVTTGRMQTVEDVQEVSYENWQARGREYGFRSLAAIPIVHEGVRYGVITVYADRTEAFAGDERRVIEHLGEVVGHAIAAVERKRALTSDEVVELSFQIQGFFDAFDLPETEGWFTLDRAVPVGGGTYLEYGSATDDMLDVLFELVETIPHWESLRLLGERTGGEVSRFELRLDDPPVLSEATALGGYVEEARVEDGNYFMRIHLAPSADARRLIDLVQETYPMAKLVARQQVSREVKSPIPLLGRLSEHLTERQLSALEAAYFAGYFEWPRDVNGEEVADSLGVSAPTFHQHLRKAQQKLLQVALEDPATA